MIWRVRKRKIPRPLEIKVNWEAIVAPFFH